jgi:hypothetical protein
MTKSSPNDEVAVSTIMASAPAEVVESTVPVVTAVVSPDASPEETAESTAKKQAEDAARQAARQAAEAAVIAEAARVAAAAAAEAAGVAAMTAEVKQASASVLECIDGERRSSEVRRADAVWALREAMATREPARIEEAWKAARASAADVCAETRLAESVVEPAKFLRDGLQCGELSEILLVPDELRGLTEEAAVAAERAACANMDVEQLRTRVTALSRYLAASRLHARSRLEAALLDQLEAAEEHSLQKLEEGLVALAEERDKSAAETLAALDADLQKLHAESVADAKAKAEAEINAMLDAERTRLQEEIRAAVLAERGLRIHEVLKARVDLHDLEEVLQKDAAVLLGSVQDHGTLALATVSLEEAVASDKSASVEFDTLLATAERVDSFSAHVLQALPSSSKALCCHAGPIPARSLLVQRFTNEIDDLAAAAFVPPGGGLFAQIVGRIFRWCYRFDNEATPPEPVSSEMRRNLEVLASASAGAREQNSDDLSLALATVESSLVGELAVRSGPALAEIRSALLVRQALLALKARVHCLSSALPPLAEP